MATLTDKDGTVVQGQEDLGGATKSAVYAQIAVPGSGSSAATLSSLCATATPPVTIPVWALFAFLTPESGAIRYRADGTDPTAFVGQPIAQGQSFPMQGYPTLNSAKLISQTVGNVIVSVEFRG